MRYQHGIMVLRAQPLHKGHQFVIEQLCREAEHVTLVLGSIQESRTPKNPFTFVERRTMLQNILPPATAVRVTGLADANTDEEWLKNLRQTVTESSPEFPSIDVTYCGGEVEAGWYKSTGWAVRLLDRALQTGDLQISATQVRQLLATHDDNWRRYVPPQNHEYLLSLRDYWPKLPAEK